MPASAESRRQLETYKRQTLRPLHCLAFVLGPLVLFQVGTASYGPTRLLAPQDIYRLLRFFGGTASYLPAMLVVAVLMLQHVLHKDPWRVDGRVLAGMLGESIIWMLPLIMLNVLRGRVEAAWAVQSLIDSRLAGNLLIAIGAGIYEEFLFRLVTLALAMLLLVDVFGLNKDYSAAGAVIGAALLFSLYHFSGDELTFAAMPWNQFVFYLLAGVYLGALYVFRGFGIAVGAHMFFDIYVAVLRNQ